MAELKKDMVEFPVAAGVSAIYFLLRKGEVVYVGQSVNVFARLSSHYQNLQRVRRGLQPYASGGKDVKVVAFDAVRFTYCPKADLDKEELRYIQLLQPKENQLLKREPAAPGLASLPFFQELLKKVDQSADREVKRRKLPCAAMEAEARFRKTRDKRTYAMP